MSHADYLEMLANDGLKPSQLARHKNTKHLRHRDKLFKKNKTNKSGVMGRAI